MNVYFCLSWIAKHSSALSLVRVYLLHDIDAPSCLYYNCDDFFGYLVLHNGVDLRGILLFYIL